MDFKSSVAAYLRKSRSDDPTETIEETLQKHLNILSDFARKNEILIKKVYKEVVSGDGLFTRPQMIALLNDVEQGMYTAIMCVDIDRLGRSSTKDSGIIMETLQDNNCKIITPDKIYDLNDEVDQFTVETKSFLARQELRSIKKRLQRGEIETLKAGGHMGEPPYGYQRKWIDKMPSLEPTKEAEIVKMIYNWYVNDGYGSYTISDKLNKLNIPAPDGGKFSRSSVRMILSNPTYSGKIIWNKTKVHRKKNVSDKHSRSYNTPDKWLIADGLHDAIIEPKIWEEAQRIRSSRSHPPAFTGVIKNPYSGIVYCAKCGEHMQRQSKKNGRNERLLCPTGGCSASISMPLFDKSILIELEKLLKKLTLKQEKTLPNTRKADIEKTINLAHKQLIALVSQSDKLHDLLEQGIYDADTFLSRKAALSEKRHSLENEISLLNAELNKINSQIQPEDIIPTIEHILNNWDSILPAEKNRILKMLIVKISYYKEIKTYNRTPFELEITWNI